MYHSFLWASQTVIKYDSNVWLVQLHVGCMVSISITTPWLPRFYNSAVKSCFRKKVGKAVLAREFIKLNKSLFSYLSVLWAKVYSQLDMPNSQWLRCQREVFPLPLNSFHKSFSHSCFRSRQDPAHILCNPVGEEPHHM